MKLNRWKPFFSITMALALMASQTAYASQVVITPLDISKASQEETAALPEATDGTAAAAETAAPAAQGTQSGGPGVTAASSETAPTGSAAETGTVPGGSTAGTAAGPSESTAAAADGAAKAANIQEPQIAAEGAVLLDAATGKVLFGKNQDTRYYPASITKLMTALLIAENCKLGDTVTFSATATQNLESGAVNINMTTGDKLTVEQCLYALLLKSANEVGNALAEHAAGSNAKFAEMMNAKAAALGCTNTHFTNPHGLHNAEHYTTPHDMALIARATFENETVKKIAATRTYTLPATKKNPSGLTITMGHKMINPNDSRYYPGILGGKTGYTSKAGNTLVTVVEQDGVRLIAVVMKSKSTHYTDTKALLDYGFALAKAGVVENH